VEIKESEPNGDENSGGPFNQVIIYFQLRESLLSSMEILSLDL